MDTTSSLDDYLSLLRMPNREEPSLHYLYELQQAHMYVVPFENLSVMRREPIILEEALLVAKLVTRKRGGFCFELNGAFCWLLNALGFAVVRVAAGVYHDKDYTPYFDHMALLVALDQPYLVDVGFGAGARMPLPLNGERRQDVSGRYRVQQFGGENHYRLLKQDGVDWQPQYRFTTTPRHLSEYQARCDYLRTSTDSVFMQGMVCTIATPRGRISLSEEHLTITQDGEQSKQPVSSEPEFNDKLSHYFGSQFVA